MGSGSDDVLGRKEDDGFDARVGGWWMVERRWDNGEVVLVSKRLHAKCVSILILTTIYLVLVKCASNIVCIQKRQHAL
jgi:hypothetical protein